MILGGTTSSDFNYTIGNSGALTADGSEPSWGDNTIDILAFYPDFYYDGGPGVSQEYWDLCLDQTTINGYMESDLMIVQVHNKTKTDGPITLPFEHALTKIIVKLDGTGSGLDVLNAKNIRLYCEYNFILNSDSNNNLSITTNGDFDYIKLGDYNSNGVTGIIPPQTLPITGSDHLDYFITFQIGTTTYKFDPTSSITLKGGYQYTFTLTIDNSTVKAKNFTVTPWETSQEECDQVGNATY